MIDLAPIVRAQARLAAYLQPTPLEDAPTLGPNIWLKLEQTNRTHAFKIRGALNALLTLDAAARQRGIVTASSGNHAQGVAYAAQLTGVAARIFMPQTTPQRKIEGVRRYNAHTDLSASIYDEAENAALQFVAESGATFISPYNDARVIAGAGTIGLEISAALPQVARVIVPVGGGGLISGIAVALKHLHPGIDVVGVNVDSAPDMYNFFYQLDLPTPYTTVADALPGAIEPGSITLDLTRRYVDRIVLVTEAALLAAMRWLLAQGWVVEGGGAVGVAALQSGLIPADRPTVIVLSGGNVDLATLRRVLNECAG
ncbi:MAG: threonine/serine dehydratase [Chloroflexi bacterium]|nr:threonine/serine dehydratase [Chloroflexota bacterium]